MDANYVLDRLKVTVWTMSWCWRNPNSQWHAPWLLAWKIINILSYGNTRIWGGCMWHALNCSGSCQFDTFGPRLLGGKLCWLSDAQNSTTSQGDLENAQTRSNTRYIIQRKNQQTHLKIPVETICWSENRIHTKQTLCVPVCLLIYIRGYTDQIPTQCTGSQVDTDTCLVLPRLMRLYVESIHQVNCKSYIIHRRYEEGISHDPGQNCLLMFARSSTNRLCMAFPTILATSSEALLMSLRPTNICAKKHRSPSVFGMLEHKDNFQTMKHVCDRKNIKVAWAYCGNKGFMTMLHRLKSDCTPINKQMTLNWCTDPKLERRYMMNISQYIHFSPKWQEELSGCQPWNRAWASGTETRIRTITSYTTGKFSQLKMQTLKQCTLKCKASKARPQTCR